MPLVCSRPCIATRGRRSAPQSPTIAASLVPTRRRSPRRLSVAAPRNIRECVPADPELELCRRTSRQPVPPRSPARVCFRATGIARARSQLQARIERRDSMNRHHLQRPAPGAECLRGVRAKAAAQSRLRSGDRIDRCEIARRELRLPRQDCWRRSRAHQPGAFDWNPRGESRVPARRAATLPETTMSSR